MAKRRLVIEANSTLDGFLAGLHLLGVKYKVTDNPLAEDSVEGHQYCDKDGCAMRVATFTLPDGRDLVVEEYFLTDDRNSKQHGEIGIAVYPQGKRPDLYDEGDTVSRYVPNTQPK